ncbi:MAG TPA: hypothetical protein VK427_14230 [Kofleriaceae bacterium]|nr:hypothetical protein [Kofleriaceae bacterium]
MGTAQTALVAAVVALGVADAHAESCTGVTPAGGRFAECFDLGNRLSVTAGSDGFGGSIKLRHSIRFDDEPDLVWKLEHSIAETTWGAWQQHLDATLYRGRYLRHARDGKILLPLGVPKKVFLPFDIGAEATLASVRWRPLARVEDQMHVSVLQIAGLVDFARTRSSRRRFALAPLVRWDIDVDRTAGRLGQVSAHAVSPFTMGMANVRLESTDGVWSGDIRVEAGTQWHTEGGWQTQARAEATLERIVLAINDRPIALTAGASYASRTDEAIARVGARIVLVHRHDKRVSLRPLASKRAVLPPAPPRAGEAPPLVVVGEQAAVVTPAQQPRDPESYLWLSSTL